MSTQPMPACEALAADPARHIFKLHLARLKTMESQTLRAHECIRIHGYLSGLMEAGLLTDDQLDAVSGEIGDFTWGPRS